MKPEKELYRDFDDNNHMFIYSVVDKKTNINISGLMLIRNDVLAVESFKTFIDEQTKEGHIKPYSEYVLKCLGCYNRNENCICDSCDDSEYEICSSKDNLEEYWSNIVEICRQDEE